MTRQQAGVSAEAVAKLVAEWRDAACSNDCEHDHCVACRVHAKELEQALATAPPEQAAREDSWSKLERHTKAMAKAQPQAASGGALSALVAKWRGQAANGRALKQEHIAVIESTAIYVFEACADELEAALAAHDQKVRESLAAWMIQNSFATGHGDTVEDLLKELKWQVEERNQKAREQALEEAAMLVEASKISSERIRIARSIRALAPAPAASKPEAKRAEQ